MKHGIYYSYWEHEWSAKFGPYIEKVAKLGFDIIEVAAHHINEYSDAELAVIRQSAKDNGIILTAGIGPSKTKNLS
ncbi:dolichol monophosphate mannose synthase, partial [bacterium M00.F.Ca.ET.156.01.1.1]